MSWFSLAGAIVAVIAFTLGRTDKHLRAVATMPHAHYPDPELSRLQACLRETEHMRRTNRWLLALGLDALIAELALVIVYSVLGGIADSREERVLTRLSELGASIPETDASAI